MILNPDVAVRETAIADPAEQRREPQRCVIVINEALSPGKACNAAAVVALTLGHRHSHLLGEPWLEADGVSHPGLITSGIPVLRASAERLAALRNAAVSSCDVVDLPRQGQETTNYQVFRQAVHQAGAGQLEYLAVGLVGPKKQVGKLVGGLALFT